MSEDLAEAQDASEGIEPADLKVSFFCYRNFFLNLILSCVSN